jgi:hypothetical protein
MTILRFSPPTSLFAVHHIELVMVLWRSSLPKSSRWTIVERSSLRATRLASVWVFVRRGSHLIAMDVVRRSGIGLRRWPRHIFMSFVRRGNLIVDRSGAVCGRWGVFVVCRTGSG